MEHWAANKRLSSHLFSLLLTEYQPTSKGEQMAVAIETRLDLQASEQKHSRSRSIQLGLALLVIISGVLLRAGTAIALPSTFYGVVVPADNFDSSEDWDAIEDSGAKVARLQFNWYHMIEHGGWSNSYDHYVENAARRNITVLPYLYGRDSLNHNQEYYANSSGWNGYLSGFVNEAVARYGLNGSFWSSHKDVPYHPISVWEVWNEPNLSINSPNGVVKGEAFGSFFKATTSYIQSVQNAIEPNPHSTVVLIGGLYQPNTSSNGNVSAFLTGSEGMKKVSGINESYSGLGLHPYGFEGSTEGSRLGKLQSNVNEGRTALNGMCTSCSAKSLWITEFGWPVAGSGVASVSSTEQANLLTSSYNWLQSVAVGDNIQTATWYTVKDLNCCGTWAQYDGLREANGHERPAWCAYRAVTLGAPCPAPPDSDPDVSAGWGGGRLDIYARGSENSLHHKWFDGSSWHDWENLGGPSLTSGVGAASWGAGRLDVVGRVSGDTINQWWWDGKWHTNNLGCCFSSAPDITESSPERQDVFARGYDNALWQRWWSGGSWSNWISLGGNLTSHPSAVSTGPNRLDVVARVAGNTIEQWWWESGTWHTFNLGCCFSSAPSISSGAPGWLDVYARGEDNALWHRWWHGGWSSWERLGHFLRSGPGVVQSGLSRVDVVARVPNGSISQYWWDGSTWHEFNLGGYFFAPGE
ncbi:MAG TPA: hypothetical protein VLX28_13460 [Thermoanaerobaculia bacterium]|nr:hypothetical protein [Thermoanaerobaculia bacterium]